MESSTSLRRTVVLNSNGFASELFLFLVPGNNGRGLQVCLELLKVFCLEIVNLKERGVIERCGVLFMSLLSWACFMLECWLPGNGDNTVEVLIENCVNIVF